MQKNSKPYGKPDFIRISKELLIDPFWKTAPTAHRVVWITLLSLANFSGNIDASHSYIARMSGVSKEEYTAATKTLSTPDPSAKDPKVQRLGRITKTHQGWNITSFKTQFLPAIKRAGSAL